MAALEIKGALPSLEQKVTRVSSEAEKIYIKDYEQLRDTESKYKGKMVEASDYTAATNYYKEDEPKKNSLDLKNMAGLNLLVSTIIATVTFAAAFSMPGGYNEKGMAISSGKKAFKMFLLFNYLAFGCSAASMFVHFLAAAWPRRLCFTYPTYCVTVLTELSLVGIALAFVHGSLAVFPDNSGLANLATNSVLLSFSIPILYFCLKIGYNAYYLFKGHGLSSKKRCYKRG